ncbi:MAG: hypothetical protein U0Z26_07130 [Anaerolineales bacterium]
MNTTFVMLLGLFVRLFVPLSVTAVVVYFLRKLDIRWQAEAEKERKALVKDDQPCWKEQGLSVDEMAARSAQSNQACWQTHRLSNGYLREACFDCEVFRSAPAPVSKHSPAHI